MVGCYVHVPFCARRCGYCDFNTAVLGASPIKPDHWLAALRAEIDLTAQSRVVAPLATVFFGGGTPTLIGDALLTPAMQAIERTFGLEPNAEVTIEANPETITEPLLDALLAAGFNRLSLGMQSADESVLTTLDRAHTPGQVVRSVEAAKRAGFAEVSLDLIYGTPGETMESWTASVQAALAMAPTHISCYALILEPATPLAKKIAAGQVPPTDDDLMADEYLAADDLLTAAGLRWYELSNWARVGSECRHNLGYWLSDDWLGLGPGAHAHIGRVRSWNHRATTRWAAALERGELPIAGSELIDDFAAHEEALLLELRLARGLRVADLSPTEVLRVPAFIGDALLDLSGDRIVLTRRGRLLADKVVRDLLD